MKKAIILHNPGAGDENHVKSDLIQMVEENGYKSLYYVVKKNKRWTKRLEQVDFAIVAGGDGTVRRVAKELIKRTLLDKQIPLALLPMGTANNLSKTLGIDSKLNYNEHIKNWREHNLQAFDLGVMLGNKETHIFLEAAGFGLFPALIRRMDELDITHLETAEEELLYALETLYKITLSAPAHKYQIKIGKEVYTGKSILTEVLNTPYIGPNLHLAPEAKIDDGLLDVVCVDESQREEFASYIKGLIQGDKAAFLWKTYRADKLTLKLNSQQMHIDDELIAINKSTLHFEIRKNVLGFLH